jgi:hypothetical protein
MLADTLKPQAAFRDLGDTVSRGSMMFCGLGESIEPPASTTFGRRVAKSGNCVLDSATNNILAHVLQITK